jgi:multidrug resistance efflux pump
MNSRPEAQTRQIRCELCDVRERRQQLEKDKLALEKRQRELEKRERKIELLEEGVREAERNLERAKTAACMAFMPEIETTRKRNKIDSCEV